MGVAGRQQKHYSKINQSNSPANIIHAYILQENWFFVKIPFLPVIFGMRDHLNYS